MTDNQKTILYIMANMQNQNQVITLEALRQPLRLLECGDEEIADELARLCDIGLVTRSGADHFHLTKAGKNEASRTYKVKTRIEFNDMINRASESKAYLDFCTEVYGYRMPLFNMMDKEQLDFVFNSIPLSSSDTVLDLGCGTGSIVNHLVNRYGCQGIGIDQIDPQGAARDGSISYIEGDIDDFLAYKVTPNVCLSVDSLYFSADLLALINSMKSIPGIRMYLFYSQYIFDPENKDETLLQADHTRLASVLRQAGLTYKTINFSTNERLLYENWLKALPQYHDRFASEGNIGLYEYKFKECSMGKSLYDQRLASRYLYMAIPD